MMFVDMTNPHNFTVDQLKEAGRITGNWGWQTLAQNYTMRHGVCGVMIANDDFVLFFRDGEVVRRKTWKAIDVDYIIHRSS